jgi:glycogen synthase
VLMEAMALGVPVVASRVAGIPELVDDQANGLLFTPSNWDELATCVQRLLDDKSLYERVASEARATVEAGFDTRRSARQLAQLFAQMAEREQPPPRRAHGTSFTFGLWQAIAVSLLVIGIAVAAAISYN